MDALEESAEFLGSLEKFFQRTDNARVKYAYMEAFNRLILPVAGVRVFSIMLTDRLQPQKLIHRHGQLPYNLSTLSSIR
jgi:Cell morphogenesis N-terminal